MCSHGPVFNPIIHSALQHFSSTTSSLAWSDAFSHPVNFPDMREWRSCIQSGNAVLPLKTDCCVKKEKETRRAAYLLRAGRTHAAAERGASAGFSGPRSVRDGQTQKLPLLSFKFPHAEPACYYSLRVRCWKARHRAADERGWRNR